MRGILRLKRKAKAYKPIDVQPNVHPSMDAPFFENGVVDCER
ncbi:MAG: hypothetical protein Q7U60_01375 [Candidatus Methanoperedens sp.]|nr:hypothetical protein [Candidatus Methanoperedens sp.]